MNAVLIAYIAIIVIDIITIVAAIVSAVSIIRDTNAELERTSKLIDETHEIMNRMNQRYPL